MAYKDWFEELCEGTNKDLKLLAKKLDLHDTAIGKMRRGERAIKADELPIICDFFGTTLPGQPATAVALDGLFISVPVDGTVQAGSFREPEMWDDSVQKEIVIQRDSHYPTARHVAYEVHGDSMINAGIQHGDTILCLDYQDMGGNLINDAKVVIEQNRDGMIERSVKAVAIYKDRVEFQPRSDDPKFKAIVLPNKGKGKAGAAQIKVLAVVRKITRDA